jgi:hypothetical protein
MQPQIKSLKQQPLCSKMSLVPLLIEVLESAFKKAPPPAKKKV